MQHILNADNLAAAIAAAGSAAVFAHGKARRSERHWWCMLQSFNFPDGGGPDLIVDDGGDATDGTYGCQGEQDRRRWSIKYSRTSVNCAMPKGGSRQGRDYWQKMAENIAA